MLNKEALTRLLAKLENRLEDCMRCGSCLSGIMAALEFAVEEAKRLRAGLAEGEGRVAAPRAFAIAGSLKAVMPWEKIHV
jgi:hypothetical protein